MLRRPILRASAGASSSTSVRVPCRSFIARSGKTYDGRPSDGINLRRLAQDRADYDRTRKNFLAVGALAGVVSIIFLSLKLKKELATPTKFDSTLPPDALAAATSSNRKVVIHDEQGREIVPTGNTTVPEFPRTIELPARFAPVSSASTSPSSANVMPSTVPPSPMVTPSADSETPTTEYTLVGLGLRTVSFFKIQVYVVGYYVATADVAALQARLVKMINPIATTLVPGERDQLRSALLDPAAGEETWDELLREGIPARSAFRVVPVRDTDFHHLRDGFVRAIQGRSGKLVSKTGGDGATGAQSADDLGESMREFRQLFNRGKVPKKQELLLIRHGGGRLSVLYDEGKSRGRQLLGTVEDERISRAMWLNYLAGKQVASEAARQSIVEGVMEFVERPVGTVAAQVI